MLVVFCRRLGIHMTRHRAIMWKHDVIHKTGSTACTLHNNLTKFVRVVSKLCERTNRQTNEQTDKHTHHNILHPSQGCHWLMKSPWSTVSLLHYSQSRRLCHNQLPHCRNSSFARHAWGQSNTPLSGQSCLYGQSSGQSGGQSGHWWSVWSVWSVCWVI